VWPADVSMVPCLNCNFSCLLIICLMSRLTLLAYFSINFSLVSAIFIWMLKVLWRPTQTVQFYRLSCGNGCFLWPAGHQIMYLFESQWRNAYMYSIILIRTNFSCPSPRPHLPWFWLQSDSSFLLDVTKSEYDTASLNSKLNEKRTWITTQ